MTQLIKAAIVYSAEIPKEASILNKHFADFQFTEATESQLVSRGFVPVVTVADDDGDTLAMPFQGGIAFSVRIDEKIIPGSAIKKEMQKEIERAQRLEGRKPGKKERAELKYAVMFHLAAMAFARTSVVRCFYEYDTNYLIVATASKALADKVTSLLVQAVGSIKTTTINVSSVKHGLTERLKKWVEYDEDAFGRFSPCSAVQLQEEKRKISVQMGDFSAAREGLQEALSKAFQVVSLGLTLDGETQFRLNDQFRLKAIEFHHTPEDGDIEASPAELFATQALLEVTSVSAVIKVLCEMLAYENQQDNPEADAQAAE